MMTMLPDYLDRLADIQRGILTAGQAHRGGVSQDIIRQRLRSGRWQQLHRGVYAIFTGTPAREALLWAVVLRAGEGALLSHYTAAELHGLIDGPRGSVHITIPDSRRIIPIRGAVTHVSSRAALIAHPTQLPPRVRLEDTVLDLAQLAATSEAACAWIARALGRRLTSQQRLRDALGGRRRLRYRDELAEILTADWIGVNSALEYRYVKWVEIPHGLPRGKWQVRFRRGSGNEYRDVLYEEFGLVVELDGRIAHPGDTRWADIRRDNAAVTEGKSTLRYGWDDLLRSCIVADQVYAALSRSGQPVPARPCSPACPLTTTLRR